jgi:hypothetical protein
MLMVGKASPDLHFQAEAPHCIHGWLLAYHKPL